MVKWIDSYYFLEFMVINVDGILGVSCMVVDFVMGVVEIECVNIFVMMVVVCVWFEY